MTKVCGRFYLLQLGSEDVVTTFETIGCLRDLTINTSRELVDITTKDDAPNRTILGSCGVMTCSISGSGVFSDQAGFQAVHESARKGTHRIYKIVSDLGDSYQGKFEVANFERAGSYNNEESFNLSLENANMTVYTPLLPDFDGWFDATDTSTMTFVGNDVSVWGSKGTESGWDFQQTDAGKRPVVNTNGPNGTTVLDFDAAAFMESATGAVALEDNCTIFVVFKAIRWLTGNIGESHNNDVFFWGDKTLDADKLTFESGTQTENTGRFGLQIDTNAGYWTPDHIGNEDKVYENKLFLACGTFDFASNTIRFYVNGEFNAKNTAYNTGLSDGGNLETLIGVNDDIVDFSGLQIQYGDIIIINSTISITDRRFIESYLSGKWGIEMNQTEDPAI